MKRKIPNAAIAAIALALPMITLKASAQETVAITVNGVNEARGKIVIALCDETTKVVPRCRGAFVGRADAKAGETVVTIPNVKPGAYALDIYHDANGDGAFNFPAEGYAYGNDAAFPPSFAAASIAVEGRTKAQATLNYSSVPVTAAQAATDPTVVMTSMGPVRMGSKGAPAPAGAARIDVREGGLYGEFYAPVSKTNLPVLIVVSGSEGGLNSSSVLAHSFTRHGYAVLALAYFAELGLPRSLENIPLEYFDKAINWVKQRPEVDPARIGAIGGSRGSEAVLLLASRNRDVKAVLAYAPSGAMWQGFNPAGDGKPASAWTAKGEPLPYLTADFSEWKPGSPTSSRYLPALAIPSAADISIEAINGPILLISGGDDQLWPSKLMADQMSARLKAKGFKHEVQHLTYANAGHMVFAGDMTGRAALATPQHAFALGGTPKANLDAWADNWPKALSFFERALKQ